VVIFHEFDSSDLDVRFRQNKWPRTAECYQASRNVSVAKWEIGIGTVIGGIISEIKIPLTSSWEVRLANQVCMFQVTEKGQASVSLPSWHLTCLADIYIYIYLVCNCFCGTFRILPKIKDDGLRARQSSRPHNGQCAKVSFGSVNRCLWSTFCRAGPPVSHACVEDRLDYWCGLKLVGIVLNWWLEGILVVQYCMLTSLYVEVWPKVS